MTAEIIRLNDHRDPEPESEGNGAREVLIEIVTHMADCQSCGALTLEERADVILGSLWIEGFKLVPLEDEDYSE